MCWGEQEGIQESYFFSLFLSNGNSVWWQIKQEHFLLVEAAAWQTYNHHRSCEETLMVLGKMTRSECHKEELGRELSSSHSSHSDILYGFWVETSVSKPNPMTDIECCWFPLFSNFYLSTFQFPFYLLGLRDVLLDPYIELQYILLHFYNEDLKGYTLFIEKNRTGHKRGIMACWGWSHQELWLGLELRAPECPTLLPFNIGNF